MARYSPEQKAQSRANLIAAAGRKLRECGYHGVGVDGLAAEAKQTSGAFYAHFDSKEAILQEVLIQSFGDLIQRFEQAPDKGSVAREYVSSRHVENVAGGCALPTLSSDVSRSAGETREIFQQQLQQLLLCIDDSDGQHAMQTLASMIGAVVLGRALPAGAVRDELLQAVHLQFSSGEEKRGKDTTVR